MEIIDITLDRSSIQSGGSVSSDGLTFTASNSTAGSKVKATHFKSYGSGKWYWEVSSANASNMYFGVTDSNSYPEMFIYTTRNGIGATNNTIGIMMDTDKGEISYLIDSAGTKSQRIDKINPLANCVPLLYCNTNTSYAARINFGGSSFVYEIPDGYTPFNFNIFNILYLGNKEYNFFSGEYVSMVPNMTSKPTTGILVSSSSVLDNFRENWNVFNPKVLIPNNSAFWSTNSSNPIGGHWLKVSFTEPVKIDKIEISLRNILNEFEIFGSNDDTKFISIFKGNFRGVQNELLSYTLESGEFKFYRINFLNSSNSNYVAQVYCIRLLQRNFDVLRSNKEYTFLKNKDIDRIIELNPTLKNRCIRNIKSNPTTHESGKKFTHTVDLSKRRVDKIILS